LVGPVVRLVGIGVRVVAVGEIRIHLIRILLVVGSIILAGAAHMLNVDILISHAIFYPWTAFESLLEVAGNSTINSVILHFGYG
jgi:hypothetical protein